MSPRGRSGSRGMCTRRSVASNTRSPKRLTGPPMWDWCRLPIPGLCPILEHVLSQKPGACVDFSLDETQQAVADLAATVLRGDADHARVEQALASAAGYDETAWKGLAQAGLLSLPLPAALGGDGVGAVEVGLVLIEAGRQALPLPALTTLALGVLPVVAHGA